MICKCDKCEKQFDSKDGGYVLPKPETHPVYHNKLSGGYSYQEYCEDCFTEKFQCEDCGGFKNKFAMAAYDGNYCECDQD